MLRLTDMTIPRHDDEDFVELRSLAWSRSGAYLPSWEDVADPTLPEQERQQLIDDFTDDNGRRDDQVTRSLAELFLDYGEGDFPHALAWSPDRVSLFLTDCLPRKAVLDEDQRAGLAETLRSWVRFALERRGVEDDWITPVVDTVDEFLPGTNPRSTTRRPGARPSSSRPPWRNAASTSPTASPSSMPFGRSTPNTWPAGSSTELLRRGGWIVTISRPARCRPPARDEM